MDIRFNRERFLKGNSYYAKKGISAQTSQLRIEVPLVKGKDTYDFDIDKEVKRITENTLKRNDLFVARAIGLALMIEGDGANAIGAAPLMSYPMQHSDALIDSSLGGFKNTDAFVIYNGFLTMKTGQHTNFSHFPSSSFLTVPETQPVGVLKSDDTMTSAQLLPSFKMSDILYELPEELVFAGTQDHRIRLEIPANSETDFSATCGDGDTAKPYVVLIVEGWLYEGATGQEYKEDKTNPYCLAI